MASLGQWVASCVFFTGFQYGMVMLLRYAESKGTTTPTTIMGILPLCIGTLSFVPQYMDLLGKHSDPFGLSLSTMAMMVAASLAYIVSLACHPTMDWIAFGGYLVLVVGCGGLIVIAWILRWKQPVREISKSNENADMDMAGEMTLDDPAVILVMSDPME